MARKMKDSGIQWIGEIPEDWEVSKLKYLGISKNETARYKKGERFVGLEHVSSFDGRVIGYDLDYEECETPLFEKGDFLFSKLRPYLAKGFLAEKSGFCTSELIRIKFNEEQCNKYFSYLLLSRKFIDMINGMTYGVKMPRISWQELREMILTMPPRWEQMRIADYLDDKCRSIDQTHAIIRDQMTALGEYKKSVITEAVTKGLDKNVEMKGSGIEWIGEISKHWKVGKTLYYLQMPITDGPHTTPTLLDEGVPFVSAEALSAGNGKIDFNRIRGFISEEFYQECCKKYVPRIDDIYMVKSGATTGLSAIVDSDIKFTIWSPLAVFRADEQKIEPKFLFYTLQSDYFLTQVELYWNYGTQQNIGMRTLEKLKICAPSLNEQKKIVDYLDKKTQTIDEVIDLKRQQLEVLDEYKKSLIYEYVTGKREV